MSIGKYWMFTINNPTEEDNPKLWQFVEYMIFQVEKGEEGTVHLQGYVCFKKQMRLSACKKVSVRTYIDSATL